MSKPEDNETERLNALNARIARARGEKASGPVGAEGIDGSALRVAGRAGVEMVAALVVSLLIGWSLDRWLGTRPIFMIVFFFLGVGAGMINVYRVINGLGLAVGYGAPGKSGTTGKREQDDDTHP